MVASSRGAKSKQAKKKKAAAFKKTGGTAYSYTKNNRKHYITASGLRFYENDHGTLTTVPTGSVPLYNRISYRPDDQKRFRRAKLGKGSHGINYKETRTYNYESARPKVVKGVIKRPPDQQHRTYSTNMKRATDFDSATEYAQDCLGSFCPNVGFNWCHLLGHGAGGSDNVSNLMAGTTYCNSEQLQIESMVYLLTNAPFLKVKVTAQPYNKHEHLARTITYVVSNPLNQRQFTHTINALRTSQPTESEINHVRERLLAALFDRETLPPGQ